MCNCAMQSRDLTTVVTLLKSWKSITELPLTALPKYAMQNNNVCNAQDQRFGSTLYYGV